MNYTFHYSDNGACTNMQVLFANDDILNSATYADYALALVGTMIADTKYST